jgi:hypothetical protein
VGKRILEPDIRDDPAMRFWERSGKQAAQRRSTEHAALADTKQCSRREQGLQRMNF